MSQDLWAKWRPEIAKATGDHQTIESIEADLAAGRARLWATPLCCAVVEFHGYPGGALSCHIMWAAGSMAALKADLPKLEAGVKAAGCTEVLISGRAGWARVLQNDGYQPWSVTIRKEL